MNPIAMTLFLFGVAVVGFVVYRHCARSRESRKSRSLASQFLIAPYLQLGTEYGADGSGLEVVFHTLEPDTATYDVRVSAPTGWRRLLPARSLQVTSTRVPPLHTVPANRRYRARITALQPGQAFTYGVYRNGRLVFTGASAAPKAQGSPLRFAIIGDIGENSVGQAKIAYQASQVQLDFGIVPGDVTYKRGRFSEYLEKFFPILNHDVASPETGAPLMRNVPLVAVLGNHDVGRPDLIDVPTLDNYPDMLAYFYLWAQPMNGPQLETPANKPLLLGANAHQRSFLQAANGTYPRMANFSFDYGDTHWLFLDANVYMDWTDEALRSWVRQDLSRSTRIWKFVVFHQPPFTSHRRHRVEQRMRLVADIFQETGVDIVFVGHAHWYERLYPLTFTLRPQADGKSISATGAVDGEIELDTTFDGITNRSPHGVIYLVSGGGGAKQSPADFPTPGSVEPFTHKLVFDKHSFTVAELDGTRLKLRQIDEDGKLIDYLVIEK